ncbi:protein GRIP-like protein, partial [Corchorus capsularis]
MQKCHQAYRSNTTDVPSSPANEASGTTTSDAYLPSHSPTPFSSPSPACPYAHLCRRQSAAVNRSSLFAVGSSRQLEPASSYSSSSRCRLLSSSTVSTSNKHENKQQEEDPLLYDLTEDDVETTDGWEEEDEMVEPKLHIYGIIRCLDFDNVGTFYDLASSKSH